MTTKHFFTFGPNHLDARGNSLGRRYVEIEAASQDEARGKMHDARGERWAFVYSSDEFEGGRMAERYGLRAAKIEDVALPLSVVAFPAVYRSVVVTASFAAKMLEHLDFDAVIAAIDRAEAVGPIVDPTLYREKSQAMREDRELLVAARELQKIALKMSDAAEQNRKAGQ